MPPGFRRLHHAPAQPQDQVAYDAPSDSEVSEGLESVVAEALMEDVDVEGAFHAVDDDDPEGEVEDPMDGPPSPGLPPLPANLREISSLASWTVSSSKPGCSVPQLRSSDIQQFWQSDGPQPHLLNIHFFKQVSIVGVRLYLDFEADESYTPTHIQFLAGTGYNDLQQWADMRFEQPKGWIDVDFANVGRDEPLTDSEGDDDDEDDEEDEEGFSSANSTSSSPRRRRHRRRRHIPVLRAYLLQIKILENHQNGKDTHLRGVQIFARDKSRYDVDGSGEATPIVEEQKPTVAQAGGSGPSAMAERKGKRIALMPEWAKIPELR